MSTIRSRSRGRSWPPPRPPLMKASLGAWVGAVGDGISRNMSICVIELAGGNASAKCFFGAPCDC